MINTQFGNYIIISELGEGGMAKVYLAEHKLLDFGIAKNMDPNSAEYTMTEQHQIMGAPMYMSPEQVHETKNVTVQSALPVLHI